MRIHLRVYGQYKAIQEINIIPIISYWIKKVFLFNDYYLEAYQRSTANQTMRNTNNNKYRVSIHMISIIIWIKKLSIQNQLNLGFFDYVHAYI